MVESLKHLFISFLIGLILCPPTMVHAGGITPDAAAPAPNQATMDAALNGVPVVNIVAPKNGMSHNMFSDFNVGTEGVIINNGVGPGVSQLGGALAGNPNFSGAAASTILNEVTGTGRTSLLGHTEIFGQSANYILANPNGISINGGGFINTPKATLTTGTPQYSAGAFQGLDVTQGDILVEGAGINANNIDAFELVSRVTQINADIYAKELNIITGQNRHNPVSGTTTPLTPDGSIAPTVSLDTSALGGMYAGRIKLVGTEAGVGVNTLGIVQATQNLEITADGKIQIKNVASSAQDLALTSNSDEVTVSGTVKAVGTATLTGQTVALAKVDAADAPKVHADTIAINAETLTNDGLIAADSAASISATNVTNTGTIYSGDTAAFRIGDTLHNNQGIILSKGDTTLEGSVAGQMMGTLQNDSGNIESLEGSLTFRAATFNNNNSQFILVEGATQLSMTEGGYWYYGDHGGHIHRLFQYYIGPSPSPFYKNAWAITEERLSVVGLDISRNMFTKQEVLDAIAETDSKLAADPSYLTSAQISALERVRTDANRDVVYIGKAVGRTDGMAFRAITTEDSATGQELGSTIAARNNIIIDANIAKNTVSEISSAAGDIIINASSFDNVGKEIYERTTIQWGRGIFHSHESPDMIPTSGGTDVLLKPIDYAYGTLDAGNKVIISAGAVSNGVTERNGILLPPDPATQAAKVADVTDLTSLIPSNGLFQPNTNPAQNYAIETDPAITNLDTFYGSDYALSRMGFDPNEEANKRLGDAFYETRLVIEQISELTGRKFLTSAVTSDTDQMLALMNNAVDAHSDLDLSVGMALTNDQVAALTSDIVWFEHQEVNGEQVLVPVVYLGSNSLETIAQGGAVILAEDVEINTTGDTTNAGLIESAGQVVITAENFFNTQGTVSGQDIAATATDSIRNIGGTITGADVALKADNDVVIAADTVEFQGKNTTGTAIAKAGEISAIGTLSVEAGRDIGILGAEVKATGDTTLKAGENVVISTVETTFNSKNSGSGYNNHTDSTFNAGSTVKTDGALSIEAGDDVAIHGSQVETGGDADIKAGGNVSITAATDSTEFYSHNEGGGGGFFGGKKSTTIDIKEQTTVASVIKSGGSVKAEAGTAGSGDLSLQGSQVKAAEDVTLLAEGDIIATPNEVENYHKFEQKSSGFMGIQSSELTESRDVTNNRPQIEAGNKVVINAKNDVTLQAVKIKSGDETEITAQEGQVAMLVAKDSKYERELKTETGWFSWSSEDTGTVDETILHNQIETGKGLEIITAQGVVIEYKETGDLRTDIAQLSQAKGLEWMGEILERDDVDWQAVQEVHDQWHIEQGGMGGPGMSVIAIAMAVALSWTGVGATVALGMGLTQGSSMAVAVAAGFNSLVTQAVMQIAANGGDIGAAMQAMASIDTVRNLATSMLVAGLTTGALNMAEESGFIADQSASLEGLEKLTNELNKGVIRAGINTGVGTAINGGDLGENLVANLHGAAVSVLGAYAANEIGEAYDNGNGDLDYVSHKIAHAALGGAMDLAMGGDGVSGAIGGAVGEMTGEIFMEEIQEALLTGNIDPRKAQRWIDAGVDLSKLAAGLAAAAVGADINTAANTGGNAVQNNAAGIAAGTAAVLASLTPAQMAALTALFAGAAITIEEQKEQIGIAITKGATSFTNWVAEKFQGLSDEEKQQLEIPGYDITEIDVALGGTPSDTDYDDSTITTPDNTEVADSGTVSEDQSGQVDDSGVITSSSYTPEQHATAVKLGVDPKWVKPDGSLRYPEEKDGYKDGFVGTPVTILLPPGTVIDRYGGESGRFLSPAGTSFGERALPPAAEYEPPRVYKVVKPLPVKEGKAAAWFDQPGGGTQYKTEMSVEELLIGEFIEEVE